MPSDEPGPPIAVFDLGGTWFRWGCYRPSRGLSDCQRVPAVNYLLYPHLSAPELQMASVDFVSSHVRTLRSRYDIRIVGVSIGAPVNAQDMTVLGSGPMWGREAGPFRMLEHLRESSPDLHWCLINDVTALIVPYMFDESSYLKTMLITVSSGIGSRLYDHRARQIPYDSRHGVQGEIGHLRCSFELDGRLIERACECGGWNHVNAFSSGRGITQTLRDLPSLTSSFSQMFLDSVAVWTAASDEYRLMALRNALDCGNLHASMLLDAFVSPLTRTLATALTLDPEIDRIVMTGGVVRGLSRYYGEALQRMFLREELYQITSRDPDYLKNRLHWLEDDDNAGLRGVGLYAAGLDREGGNGLAN